MTEQELKEQLKRYERALAEVEALVLSHEGHISKLEDWQAKVLPWLKTKAIDLQDDIDFMEKVWRDEPESSEWLCAQKWREELKTFTDLIAEAKEGEE